MSNAEITQETCLSCGACCATKSRQRFLCCVMSEDVTRLDPTFVSANVIGLGRVAIGFYGGIKLTPRESSSLGRHHACAALEGELMSNVKCSVYEDRPRACREFVIPGDERCVKARALFGEQYPRRDSNSH